MFYLNDLCSFCLAHNSKFTSRSSINPNAEDMLLRIIPEFVHQTSGIQRKLCDDCLGSLNAVFQFRQKCLANIIIFDEYVRKLREYGSYKYLEVAITDIKLDIEKKIKREIILDANICFLENDLRTNFLEIDDNIKQDHFDDRVLNEEQEENDQNSNFALDIKTKINEEIIINENICSLKDDLRTNCLEIDENIKQESFNDRVPNEDQEEYDQKSYVTVDIKTKINEVIIINENICLLKDDLRTDCSEINDNIKQQNSNNEEYIEEQDKNDQKSYIVLDMKEESEEIILDEDTENIDEPENLDIDCDELFKCTECGEEFSNRMGDTDFSKCQKCQTIYPDTNTSNESKKVNLVNKSHVCNSCQKSFSCMSKLKVHERVHTGERPFSCNQCGKKFKQSCSVKLHEYRAHTNEKPFVCSTCRKGFTTAHELRRHTVFHKDKRSFECDVCQKWFKSADCLKKHKIIHTGIKRFQCEICQDTFYGRRDLIRHIRIHTGERLFQCKICEKSFAHSNTLRRHLQTHSDDRPFECSVCKKRFKCERYLVMHKLLHVEKGPSKCNICDEMFASSAALKTHKDNHPKPYLCEICNKSFAELRNLKRHRVMHTRKK